MASGSTYYMDDDPGRIAYLISGFIKNKLTQSEHDELDRWVNESDRNMKLFEDLTDEKNIAANLHWMDQVNTAESFKKRMRGGAFKSAAPKYRMAWAAAAAIALLAAIFFIYKYYGDNAVRPAEPVIASTLPPGGNKATLQWSDGSSIDLNAMADGFTKSVEGVSMKLDSTGHISYSGNAASLNRVFNTLSTPVGGQYEVQLGDGTRVWLNAESRLQYPVQFGDSSRTVSLRGEAYFEVAKDQGRKFSVQLEDGSSVTVLGTHFNINAYPGDSSIQVALLEGKVKVESKRGTETLEPSAVAVISANALKKTTGVDVEELVGWKNGNFVFRDASIESIMTQVQRWYGAKVQYQAQIKQLFNGTISRSEPLPKLLHLLELNGYVHFKTEKDTIYVLP